MKGVRPFAQKQGRSCDITIVLHPAPGLSCGNRKVALGLRRGESQNQGYLRVMSVRNSVANKCEPKSYNVSTRQRPFLLLSLGRQGHSSLSSQEPGCSVLPRPVSLGGVHTRIPSSARPPPLVFIGTDRHASWSTGTFDGLPVTVYQS